MNQDAGVKSEASWGQQMALQTSVDDEVPAVDMQPRTQAPHTTPGSDLQTHAEALATYRVDNSNVQSLTQGTAGLNYLLSPNLTDRDGLEVAPWGSLVYGSPREEHGFVKVGHRYLPMFLEGEPVIFWQEPAVEKHGHPQKDIQEFRPGTSHAPEEAPEYAPEHVPNDAPQEAPEDTPEVTPAKHEVRPKRRLKSKPKAAVKALQEEQEKERNVASKHIIQDQGLKDMVLELEGNCWDSQTAMKIIQGQARELSGHGENRHGKFCIRGSGDIGSSMFLTITNENGDFSLELTWQDAECKFIGRTLDRGWKDVTCIFDDVKVHEPSAVAVRHLVGTCWDAKTSMTLTQIQLDEVSGHGENEHGKFTIQGSGDLGSELLLTITNSNGDFRLELAWHEAESKFIGKTLDRGWKNVVCTFTDAMPEVARMEVDTGTPLGEHSDVAEQGGSKPPHQAYSAIVAAPLSRTAPEVAAKVEAFLAEVDGIDDQAASKMRAQDEDIQLAVMERGSLLDCYNVSSALMKRIKNALDDRFAATMARSKRISARPVYARDTTESEESWGASTPADSHGATEYWDEPGQKTWDATTPADSHGTTEYWDESGQKTWDASTPADSHGTTEYSDERWQRKTFKKTKRAIPCQFWLDGRCKRGEWCRFMHKKIEVGQSEEQPCFGAAGGVTQASDGSTAAVKEKAAASQVHLPVAPTLKPPPPQPPEKMRKVSSQGMVSLQTSKARPAVKPEGANEHQERRFCPGDKQEYTYTEFMEWAPDSFGSWELAQDYWDTEMAPREMAPREQACATPADAGVEDTSSGLLKDERTELVKGRDTDKSTDTENGRHDEGVNQTAESSSGSVNKRPRQNALKTEEQTLSSADMRRSNDSAFVNENGATASLVHRQDDRQGRGEEKPPKAPKTAVPAPASGLSAEHSRSMPSRTRSDSQAGTSVLPAGSEPLEESDGVGLSWRGRWGCWSDEGVHLLATCVGVFEVLLSPEYIHNGVDVLEAALQEVRSALSSELPTGSLLAAVHWTTARRSLRAAVVGDTIACEQLQPHWQRRTFCNGAVIVTWIRCFDSASIEHCRRLAGMFERDGVARHITGFALHLPTSWVPKESRQGSTKLHAGDHWFDFATLFGTVVRAELFGKLHDRSQRGEECVYLLLEFASPEGARYIYEALTDRYLYNPASRGADECHPVICALGNLEKMRVELQKGALQQPSLSAPRARSKEEAAVDEDSAQAARRLEAERAGAAQADGAKAAVLPKEADVVVFELRRRNPSGAAVLPAGCLVAPPEVLPLSWSPGSTGCKQYAVGRWESCALLLRHQQISKMHATFTLQQATSTADSSNLMQDADTLSLTIQDTSSNGTWVNGKLIVPKAPTELKDKDIVTFLPVGPVMDGDDCLAYEVVAKARPKATGSSSEPGQEQKRLLPMAPPRLPARSSASTRSRETMPKSVAASNSLEYGREDVGVDDLYTLPAPTHPVQTMPPVSSTAPISQVPPRRNRSRSRDNHRVPMNAVEQRLAIMDASEHTTDCATGLRSSTRSFSSSAAHSAPLGILDDPRWCLNSDPPLDWEQSDMIHDSEPRPHASRNESRSSSVTAKVEPQNVAELLPADVEEDFGKWLRSLGGEQFVAQYEAALDGQYLSVAQIRDLYKDSIHTFFEDCAIEDQEHQRLFEAAIISGMRPTALERRPGAWGPPAKDPHMAEWRQTLRDHWDEL